jgi:hypothetical protein
LQDLPSSVVFSVFTIGIVSGNNRKVSEGEWIHRSLAMALELLKAKDVET